MKNNILIFFLFLTHVLSTSTCLAQEETILEYFNASKVTDQVFLSWKITSGNTCNGIEIQHSLDSMNFSKVGKIEGICGSQSEGVSYNFTHTEPTYNKKNYYRLILGNNEISTIVSIQIIKIEENNYLIRPNPIKTSSELFFKNNNNQLVTITIYNSMGQALSKQETLEDFILIDSRLLSNGHYYFTLESTGRAIKGKFVIDK
jgi:hypothetical protein